MYVPEAAESPEALAWSCHGSVVSERPKKKATTYWQQFSPTN